MTQYQQVLEALKKLGGKGTNKDICKNIDFSEWKAQYPENSVSRYLTTGEDFSKEGDYWIIKSNDISQDIEDDTIEGQAEESNENYERGIYFITLNPEFKINTAGFLFKIGKAEKNASHRIKQYSASLPFDIVRCISFYQIPKSINLLEIEKQIRGEILGGDTIDFKVQRFIGGNQNEWLQTLDFDYNESTIKKIAKDIDKIINETIQYIIKEQ
jgi:hypothetical protein